MQKLYKQLSWGWPLGILFSLLMLTGQSQSTYWNDDFSTLPDWQFDQNWEALPGRILFNWEPVVTPFDLSVTSPLIYLDDHVQTLLVTQFLDVFSNSPDEFAEIIIVTDTGDVSLWEHSHTEGDWGNYPGEDISFSMEPFQQQTIQIKLRTWGQTSLNWNSWNIYNVRLLATYDMDLSVTSINGPNQLQLLENGSWSVDVENFGTTPLTGFDIGISDFISGDVLATINQTTNLLPGESKTFTLDWIPDIAKNTLIYGWLDCVDDQFAGNDGSDGKFLRIHPDQPVSILFWNFDNGISDVISPETGTLVTSGTGFKMVLEDAGLTYQETNSLPSTLDGYDMILATMGTYCLT